MIFWGFFCLGALMENWAPPRWTFKINPFALWGVVLTKKKQKNLNDFLAISFIGGVGKKSRTRGSFSIKRLPLVFWGLKKPKQFFGKKKVWGALWQNSPTPGNFVNLPIFPPFWGDVISTKSSKTPKHDLWILEGDWVRFWKNPGLGVLFLICDICIGCVFFSGAGKN